MKAKKMLSVVLSTTILLSCISAVTVVATETSSSSTPSFAKSNEIYAHAVLNSEDTEAWQYWQGTHYGELLVENSKNEKYFFLPSSADENYVDIYNTFSEDIVINGYTIKPNTTEKIKYSTNTSYKVKANGTEYILKFMKSTAEAAVYVNNTNADGNGMDLMSYLNGAKSNSASATGAIVNPDGTIDNSAIKKIKGRGNTSWQKAKKGYNITYSESVSVGTMEDAKKFSILANYQDDSLSRNRFLYDLSDAVGMPYSSDSRYVDFYANGYYWGSYLMCEKIDTGKTNLLNDIDEKSYLNKDGSINKDFDFVCEVDASAGEDDYYFVADSGRKVTIKTPELAPEDVGYNEVKNYVKEKYDAMYDAIKSTTADVTKYIDVPSVTKLYLINELGKNWDSGVSSTFFTYKQDENGVYKFYGSPVWDYDNSLGNAKGILSDLVRMGVVDYTEYSGWWCKYKDKSLTSKSTSNIMNRISRNKTILAAAPEIWFEEFVPAIQKFSSKNVSDGELYSADVYYNYISGSAAMNYASGWNLYTGDWICDHSKLKKATFDFSTNTYNVSKTETKYDKTFEGMYSYCVDWFTSRAAWLSSQMIANYTPTYPTTQPTTTEIDPARPECDVNNDGIVDIQDATTIQLYCALLTDLDDVSMAIADVNKDSSIDVQDVTQLQIKLLTL